MHYCYCILVLNELYENRTYFDGILMYRSYSSLYVSSETEYITRIGRELDTAFVGECVMGKHVSLIDAIITELKTERSIDGSHTVPISRAVTSEPTIFSNTPYH